VALTDEENSTILRLSRKHDSEIPELERLDQYYEGTQGLSYMHPEIFAEVRDRIHPVIIFWVQMAIDAIVERLRVQGFKTGDDDLDAELHRVWIRNDMDLGFGMAMTDALVMRRSYVSVGTNEVDTQTPLVVPESPLELYAENDPRTRKTRAALRRTADVAPDGGIAARYATLYMPDRTIWCTGVGGGWREDRRDEHGLGEVPIAALVNRPRTRSAVKHPRATTMERVGRSDVDAIRPLVDGASKLATDMMVAAEFVAIPLRALFGVGPSDFKDEQGNPMTPLKAMLGRLLTIPDEEVKAFEFAAAQLTGFTGSLDALAKLVASVTGLPPHYLGMSSDNPASAEAIAGSESRMATRAERKQDPFGAGARQIARLVRRFQTGEWDPDVDTVKVDWRDVRTPTVGAMADASTKLYQAKIIPLRQTREALGYDDAEIEAMQDEDEVEAQRNPAAQLARGLADQRPVGSGDVGADA
jgi:hypothetical protein